MNPTNNFLRIINQWKEKDNLSSNLPIRGIVQENINVIKKIKDDSILIFQDDGRITFSKLEENSINSINTISLDEKNENLEKFINFAKDHFSDLLLETKTNELCEQARIPGWVNVDLENKEKKVDNKEERVPIGEIIELNKRKNELEKERNEISSEKEPLKLVLAASGVGAIGLLVTAIVSFPSGVFVLGVVFFIILTGVSIKTLVDYSSCQEKEKKIQIEFLKIISLIEERGKEEKIPKSQDPIPLKELPQQEQLKKMPSIMGEAPKTQAGYRKFLEMWASKIEVTNLYDFSTAKYPIYETYYSLYEKNTIDEFQEFIEKTMREYSDLNQVKTLNKEEIEALHEKFMKIKTLPTTPSNISNT